MPIDEDVGFIVMGVSWSDVDVLDENKEKVPDGDFYMDNIEQEQIVKALHAGREEDVRLHLTKWLVSRVRYETKKYKSTTWYGKVGNNIFFYINITGICGLMLIIHTGICPQRLHAIRII